MITENVRARNRNYWQRTEGAYASYPINYQATTIEEFIRDFSSAAQCSSTCTWYAFKMLMCGLEQQAHDIFRWAIRTAQYALEHQDYDRHFYPLDEELVRRIRAEEVMDRTVGLTPKLINIQEKLGREMSLRAWHHAQWLLTGVRPFELWQQTVIAAEAVYESYGRRPFSHWSCGQMLTDLVEAERYDDVINLYRRDFRKALTDVPKTGQFVRSRLHTLYCVAEYCRGRSAFRDVAERGINYWYQWAQHWEYDWEHDGWTKPVNPLLTEWERLSWAYLRATLFTKRDSLAEILDDLRAV